jgi:hypothetical protein
MTGGNFQSSVFLGKKFRLVKLLLADPRQSACINLAEYLQLFKILVSDESDSRTQDIAAEIMWKKRGHQKHRHRAEPATAGHGSLAIIFMSVDLSAASFQLEPGKEENLIQVG